MTTLVRVIKGADFSGLNLGYINLEPEIILPTTDIVFASRLRTNLERSQPFEGAGELFVTSGHTDLDYASKYATALLDSSSALSTEVFVTESELAVDESATMIAVIKIPASMPTDASVIMGYNRSSVSNSFGMMCDSSGNIIARSRDTGTGVSTAASVAVTDLDRWEMVTIGRDATTDKIWVYIPRKSQYVEEDLPTTPEITGRARLLTDRSYSSYSSGQIGFTGAFAAMWKDSLSTSDIDDVYTSVKSALNTSGIDI